MSDFREVFDRFDWGKVCDEIYSKNEEDVVAALGSRNRSLEDFKALVSPAADRYLEKMAQKSHQYTLRRFGTTIQLYAPLYLSNECQNICTYCGFSLDNKIPRKTLNPVELEQEAQALTALAFRHVLLVTGEANKMVGMPYFRKVIEQLRKHFDQISIEVQPLSEEDYKELVRLGVHAVLVYQETYHKENYRLHHPKGRKSDFYYRLETPDRLGRAGVYKIGLGALIGLEDWRVESFFVALHLRYLRQTYWRTRYSISFPRLRPFVGGLAPKVVMNDRELVQLITAYRLFDQEVELSLSTREPAEFRDHLVRLGVTSMSAGSATNPGGYSVAEDSLEQFDISDERSPAEVARMLEQRGYEPVWKDWDVALDGV